MNFVMTTKTAKALVLILALGLTVAGCAAQANPDNTTAPPTPNSPSLGIKIGDLAPDFKMTKLNRESVSLTDLRGHPVFINFWSPTCPPCVAELPMIQATHEKWQDKGVVVLPVSLLGTSSQIADYLESRNLSLPSLVDDAGGAFKAYQIQYVPTSYFIDTDGVIRDIVIGAFSSIVQIEEKLAKIMP
jgi:peroxiredoxin